MERYLIFSDSHGNRETLLAQAERIPCNGVIHLGDHESDAMWLLERTNGPVIAVRGNCDLGGTAPSVRVITLSGLPFFITHGHTFSVKSGIEDLVSAAREHGAAVLLFGHTHVPILENRNGLLIMNPGAARNGAYGVIEIENGKAKGALLTDDQG